MPRRMDLIGEDFSDLGAHLLGLIQMNLCCARLNIFSASPLIRGERTEVRAAVYFEEPLPLLLSFKGRGDLLLCRRFVLGGQAFCC